MQLFRAIPASRLADAAIGIGRQSTVRVHSNVPYVVDNLWESLRPKKCRIAATQFTPVGIIPDKIFVLQAMDNL